MHAEVIDWFLSMPLWVDLPGLHVVHACWHAEFVTWLTTALADGHRLTREMMTAATTPSSEPSPENGPTLFTAVDCLLKGLEVQLPSGQSFADADGHTRISARVRWWDDEAVTIRDGVHATEAVRSQLSDAPLPKEARVGVREHPVCFGHYWLTGSPTLLSSRAACVDYSAGAWGPLVAYRYDGEPQLERAHLAWVS